MAKKRKKRHPQTNSVKSKTQQLEKGSFGDLLQGALTKKKTSSGKASKVTKANKNSRKRSVVDNSIQKDEKGPNSKTERNVHRGKLKKTSVKKEKKTREVVFVKSKSHSPSSNKIKKQGQQASRQKLPKKKHKKEKKNLGLESITYDPMSLDLQQNKIIGNGSSPYESQEKALYGCKTQIHSKVPSEESDIIIGLDLGTSCTKVVVRDLMLNQAYAVPFNQVALKDNIYLLPTAVYVRQDGTLSLHSGDIFQTDLKLNFLNKQQDTVIQAKKSKYSLTAEELLVGYLAITLRFIRGWFFEKTGTQYENTQLIWNLNMGIPSESYDNKHLCKQYELIAQIAWFLSVQNQPVNIDLIKKSFIKIRKFNELADDKMFAAIDDAKIHPYLINSHPEVVMEVVGYTKSPLGEKGTHLLVDVGAGTLDVASFSIHELDSESIYLMHSSKVADLGSVRLHRERMSKVKSCLEESINQIYSIENTDPLPIIGKYQVSVPSEEIETLDKEFSSKCYEVVGEVMKETKIKRAARADVWSGRLPVFVCGGGSKEEVYSKMLHNMSDRFLKVFQGFDGFRILEIPKPDTLQAPEISSREYNRLAVAYGLSFSNDEIGKIIPERNIANDEREEKYRDYRENFVGSEMI